MPSIIPHHNSDQQNTTVHESKKLDHKMGHHGTTIATDVPHLNNATNNYMNPVHKGVNHAVVNPDVYGAGITGHSREPAVAPVAAAAAPVAASSANPLGHGHAHTHSHHNVEPTPTSLMNPAGHDHAHHHHHSHEQPAHHTHLTDVSPTNATNAATRSAAADPTVFNNSAALPEGHVNHFNPDPSLRQNNFDVMQDFNRLQTAGSGHVGAHGHHSQHVHPTTAGDGLVSGQHHSGVANVPRTGLSNTATAATAGAVAGGLVSAHEHSHHTTGSGHMSGHHHTGTAKLTETGLSGTNATAGSTIPTGTHAHSHLPTGTDHVSSLHQTRTNPVSGTNLSNTGTTATDSTHINAPGTGMTHGRVHGNDATHNLHTGSAVAGSTAAVGAGTASSTSGVSRHSTASSDSKGEHSVLHGQVTAVTGSIKESMGKLLKKPVMAEAGLEQKVAGKEEVAIAKEEKSAEKAAKKH